MAKDTPMALGINPDTVRLNEENIRGYAQVHVYCGKDVPEESFLDDNIRLARRFYKEEDVVGKTPEATTRISQIPKEAPLHDSLDL